MPGCVCITKSSWEDDLIIEKIGYNIIASSSLFKNKVKIFWFRAGVCTMMATHTTSLSHRYLVALIACILLLRVCTKKQWDRGVSLQYTSWTLCTVSQLHTYNDYCAWSFQRGENFFIQRHIYSALIVSVSGVRRELLKKFTVLYTYIGSLRKGVID